ncbi:MAG TPA: ectoine/hydroxyectoine ABC transporter permease subunit EhuD [Thermoanaerobaculia bacterium]|nr:ectoine/hydroxyectoine ABC transporter permease subunit EhuD [Thermoanaerobaculia bacterium]
MTFDLAFALEILPALLRALRVTVAATFGGTALALTLGLALAVMRRAPNAWVARPASWLVEVVRSTPLLIQVYFLYYALPGLGLAASPFLTGVLALGFHYSSYAAEVYRAGIEAVPRGQWEAGRALGFPPRALWLRVLLPQAIPPIVPALGNYVVAMFKDTPLLAAITVLELLQTAKIIGAERFRYLEPLTLVGLLFLALSLIAAAAVRRVERRLVIRHA